MLTKLRARACLNGIGIVLAVFTAVTFFPVELAAQSVTATPTTVASGGTVTVTVANGPGNPQDWVALALTSAPDTTYVDWKYLNNSTVAPPVPGLTAATVQLVAPATGGQYEVRFFANFGFTRLGVSNSITVQGGATSPPTVTASPATVAPGGLITVTVANGPANPTDWLTLSSTSASDSTYLSWKYLNGLSTPPATGMSNATLQFVAPMTLGTYNLRFFANDTWVRIGTSNTVTVGTAATPSLTINSATVAEGNGAATTATFTVTLTPTSAQTVTVAYATANGTATAGNDYVAASGTLTFAPGVATRPLPVSITGDTTAEPDETFVVILSSPTNAVLGTTQGVGTITNDDAAGGAATVTALPATVAPGGVITVTVANGPGNPNDWVTLGPASGPDTTYIAWKYLNGSTVPPAAGLPNATLQFVAPMTSGTYNVRLFENDSLSRVATSGAVTVGTAATSTLTINTASVPEGNSGTAQATFTVTLTPTSAQTVTVAYATGNGTATAGSDYVAASGTLTFAPGVATQPLPVTVNGDTTIEPNETFVVTLSSPTNAVLGSAQGSGTIVNDDAPAGATVTATPASVAPGGVITVTVANGPGNTNDWLTLGLTSAPDQTYVGWKYLNGSSTPPAVGLTNATVQFVAPTAPGTYGVRFFSNDSWTRLATSSNVTVQSLPTLTINSASVPEGNSGTTSATFTVTLNPTSAQTVTVAYATGNGTATAGSDYAAASGTLTFAPGVATQPLPVSVTGDTTAEPDETFVVTLSSPTNAVLGSTQGAGTIVNDDAPAGATVTATPASVAPGGVITVTVANGPGNTNDWLTLGLTSAPDQTYVGWKYLNGSSTPPAVGLTNGTVQFVAPTAPGTYGVRFFSNDSWTRLATSSNVTVQSLPTLTINSASVPEGNSGTTSATFTVTLNPTSAQTVTVAYATGNGTATAGSDYVAASGTLTFAPGVATRPLPVSVTGDTTAEPDETFVVTLSSPTNAVLGSTQGAGTIVNDDTPPGPTVTAAPASVATGGVITVTVANGPGNTNDWVTMGLTSAPDQTYVGWKYLNGTATAPAVGLTSATLQFVAPTTPGTYNFRFFVSDSLTRLATSTAITVTDSTGPVISSVAASSITATGATIAWTTNEASDSQVDYGLTTAYGSTSALNSSLVTSHTTTLGSLTPTTLYHFRVRSRDAAGNLTTSADFTFSTLDTTLPVISAVAATAITATGATISWTTDEASDTQVNYGPTTAYASSTVLNGSLVTAHTAALSGLTANTLYHYRVRSRDAAGNLALSGDLTFTTLAGADVTPPTVSVSAPSPGATVGGTVTVSATAADAGGVAGVQFRLDGSPLGAEDLTAPYSIAWNTAGRADLVFGVTKVAVAGMVVSPGTGFSKRLSVSCPSCTGDDLATEDKIQLAAGQTSATFTFNVPAHYLAQMATFKASGTPAYVQGATATSNSASATIAQTFGSNVSAGNLLVVAVAWEGNSAVSVTDNRGNTYAVATSEFDSVNGQTVAIVYAANAVGGATTVTASFGGATPTLQRFAIHEYDGIATSSPLDVTATNIDEGVTTANTITSGLATTTVVPPVSNGSHTLTAQARDTAGNATTSATVTVTVANGDTTPPVVSGVTVSAITGSGATIGWTTNEASDSQVDYGLTTAYGSVSPLNGSLVTAHSVIVGALAANTTYHYRVRSKDSAGNSVVSGDFTFTTLVVDLTLPVVSITAPAASATVSGTVTFSATASDNVGVTGVEFKRDGVNVAPEDTAAPYTVSWDTTTTSQGVHTLTAVAWDAAGNSATATRTVTVSNPLATVQLAWDANTEADLAGYRVKVGTTSGVYTLSNISVGNVTSYTVTGLPPGDVYYFAVTAVNLSGAESVASNEVSASR